MKPIIKILMILTGVVTVMITTLFLTSRLMDVWMLSQGRGMACDCGIRSWEEIWDEADTVLTARVVAVSADTPAPMDAQSAPTLLITSTVTLKVERVWKDQRVAPGDAVDPANAIEPLREGLPATLHQVMPVGGCLPIPYAVGSPYLILAQRQGNAIAHGPCSANRKWTRLDELFLSMGIGEPPGPPVLVPSQVRGPMLLTTMLLSALVVAMIAYLGRDPDAG